MVREPRVERQLRSSSQRRLVITQIRALLTSRFWRAGVSQGFEAASMFSGKYTVPHWLSVPR